MDKLVLAAAMLPKNIAVGTVIYAAVFLCGLVGLCKRSARSVPGYVAEYLFVVYTVCVLSITGILDVSRWHIMDSYAYNLIPFVNEGLKYILLNVLLFFPMGFLLLPAFPRAATWSTKKIILLFVCFTVVIEVIQLLFIGRMADIDDVIANTLGGVVGYVAYLFVWRATTKIRSEKAVGIGSLSLLLLAVALFWGLPINRFCMGDVVLNMYALPTWSGGLGALSGVHFTLMLSIAISALAWLLATRHSSDLFANGSITLAKCSVAGYAALIIVQCVWHGFGLYC